MPPLSPVDPIQLDDHGYEAVQTCAAGLPREMIGPWLAELTRQLLRYERETCGRLDGAEVARIALRLQRRYLSQTSAGRGRA
jgi:hypothetical protein